MKTTTQFSNQISKSNFNSLSSYYKLDLPTGKVSKGTCNRHICVCGKSENSPFCDESHAKCVDGMVNPWF